MGQGLLLPVALLAAGVGLIVAVVASLRDPERRRVERNLELTAALAPTPTLVSAPVGPRRPRRSMDLETIVSRRVPATYLRRLGDLVDRAGLSGTTTPTRLLLQKVGLALAGVLLAVLALSGGVEGPSSLVALAMPPLLFQLPDIRLGRRADERRRVIVLALAETLDLMTITVEAGVAFEAAMARAAQSSTGPLADELTRTMQEMQVGVPRPQALRELAERCDVEDLSTFVAAIIQAERYGVPITRVLRVQSSELRDKRRQRAEEAAMKIPAKVILPLAVCILPAMMLLVVGPAVLSIVRSFAQL